MLDFVKFSLRRLHCLACAQILLQSKQIYSAIHPLIDLRSNLKSNL
ncbi:hypothetical protein CSUNSWCD_1085 [Campylobacter showae CSUNSWCD]|uniref:Uncharacterized protein n=1 Tax=Campylobacter showae CSUNSWCD TaxID=1244083 RepID=M5IHF2_9BACT|nr:hypothetical protein CSUNSWCD_1085 [Campylobacter showae CSUNSWCD]